MKSLDRLEKGALALGIRLDEKQLGQFEHYYAMLIETNKVMNLTSITEWEDVVDKHFIDSLSIVRVARLKENDRIMDMGTGAGFPGIPLKIAFPDTRMTLMDSLNKRIGFLKHVISELELENIEAVHSRAEELARKPEYREQFDLCVSRAVANMSTLSEYCLPFVKIGGKFVPYKSGNVSEELNKSQKAIAILGGKISHVDNYTLMGTDASRSLIIVDKVRMTGKTYPRKAGKPSKEPLS